jgi:WD40 repeat protein
LITGSGDKRVRRILVEKRKVDKDFGRVCDNPITKVKITADGEKLFVGDSQGYLKLISSTKGKLIKDFGIVHELFIGKIVISSDQKFFFTSSLDGELKQWN